jgi:hypothetical protein
MTVKKTVTTRKGRVSLPQKSKPAPKRPNPNPDMPLQKLGQIGGMFTDVKQILEDYVANLRPLDRKRLNTVGIKKQGFIHRAYDYAMESPQFLPQYLPMEKFKRDEDYFNACRILYETCKQIQELLWNLTVQSADIVYTDALEFYASVREAAKRRIDGAETIYKDLEVFFKKKRSAPEEPAGKKRKRIVIDEEFSESERFRETE